MGVASTDELGIDLHASVADDREDLVWFTLEVVTYSIETCEVGIAARCVATARGASGAGGRGAR